MATRGGGESGASSPINVVSLDWLHCSLSADCKVVYRESRYEDPCFLSVNMQPGYCASTSHVSTLASGIDKRSRIKCPEQVSRFTKRGMSFDNGLLDIRLVSLA